MQAQEPVVMSIVVEVVELRRLEETLGKLPGKACQVLRVWVVHHRVSKAEEGWWDSVKRWKWAGSSLRSKYPLLTVLFYCVLTSRCLLNSPSNEWQDAVTERLKAAVRSRSIQQSGTSSSTGRPSLTNYPPGPARVTSTGQLSPEQSTSIGVGTARSGERERQRRRVSVSHVQGANLSQSPERPILSYPHGQSIGSTGAVPELTSPLTTTSTSRYSPPVAPTLSYASVDAFSDLATGAATAASSRVDSETGEDEEGITDAVGQLSLNEDAQVRFHGKASGLHLLGQKPRMDGRNKGGIWQVTFDNTSAYNTCH